MKKLISVTLFFILCSIVLTVKLTAQNTSDNSKIENIQEFCSNLKGFNLLGKFDVSWSNQGFKEKEFQAVRDLGFNFARLPVDYRTYTLTGNWNYFVESWVNNIDDAVEWGEKYDVHVCLNLHRAPGYCVNEATNLPAEQQLDLWTDTVAQNTFVNHWKYFAERYKDISPERLSFNLVNEPSNVSEADYVSVMMKAVKAIHEISPDRLIFIDGLNYAGEIILSLKDEPNVAQAIHSYQPFQLTHYKAGWVNGSDTWPVPHWPMLMVNNYLYGPWKSDFKSPLVFMGNIPKGTQVTVNVHQVSTESTLQIKADNKVVYSKKFICSADPGTDFTEVVETQWGFQNISNKDFSVNLTDSVSSLSFENVSGDWMIINSVALKSGNDSVVWNLSDNTWGEKQSTYTIDAENNLKTVDGKELFPFSDYLENFELARENNIPFMVQEFGVHNQTPHETSVAFLDDLIGFFEEQEVGWALWNLNGSFGILNSGRTDCNYEAWQGYQLDRQMLDVLSKSVNTSSEAIKTDNPLKIYPSPAKDVLFISGTRISGKTIIQLTDLSGCILKQVEIQTVENVPVKLDVSGIKPNLYLLTVQFDNERVSKKVLIR